MTGFLDSMVEALGVPAARISDFPRPRVLDLAAMPAEVQDEYWRLEARLTELLGAERADSGYVVPLGSPIRPEMRPGDEVGDNQGWGG